MLTKSIKSQLKGMLENENLWESIQNRPRFEKGCYGEVYTGDLYRSAVIKTFLESGDNFTMTLNTDGVQVFNSSKYQIWPIMCAINEMRGDQFQTQVTVYSPPHFVVWPWQVKM